MKSRYIFSLNIPSIYLLCTKSKKSALFKSAPMAMGANEVEQTSVEVDWGLESLVYSGYPFDQSLQIQVTSKTQFRLEEH